MNYIFRKDDAAHLNQELGTFLVHVKIDEGIRPRKGTQLVLPISRKLWRVIRVDPPSNPTGQQNTYYVEESGPLPKRPPDRFSPFV